MQHSVQEALPGDLAAEGHVQYWCHLWRSDWQICKHQAALGAPAQAADCCVAAAATLAGVFGMLLHPHLHFSVISTACNDKADHLLSACSISWCDLLLPLCLIYLLQDWQDLCRMRDVSGPVHQVRHRAALQDATPDQRRAHTKIDQDTPVTMLHNEVG